MTRSPAELSFFEHLDELRSRLIKCLVVVVVVSCLFYSFLDPVLAAIIRPVGKVIFTSPADAFVARILLTVGGGVILSLPVILYQLWQFVAAGLKEHERKYVYFFAPLSLILFLAGGSFGYLIMIPIAMKFLLGFATEMIVPMITIKEYISFVATMVLAFGVVFELPLVLMFLAKIGIATPAFLSQKRRYAIIIILIISALITPPDVITQLIMAGPLIVLYEIGVLLVKLTYKS